MAPPPPLAFPACACSLSGSPRPAKVPDGAPRAPATVASLLAVQAPEVFAVAYACDCVFPEAVPVVQLRSMRATTDVTLN